MSSLYDVFLDGQCDDVTWHQLWCRLIVLDEFNRMARIAIHRYMRRHKLPSHMSPEDLYSEAVLHLGKQLKRDKNLWYDHARLDKFEAWFVTVIYNCCVSVQRTHRSREKRIVTLDPPAKQDDHYYLHEQELLSVVPYPEIAAGLLKHGTITGAMEGTGLSFYQTWRRARLLGAVVKRRACA